MLPQPSHPTQQTDTATAATSAPADTSAPAGSVPTEPNTDHTGAPTASCIDTGKHRGPMYGTPYQEAIEANGKVNMHIGMPLAEYAGIVLSWGTTGFQWNEKLPN